MISYLEDGIPVITPEWQTELWLLDPGPFIDIAFDMGFRNFVFRAKYHMKIKQDFSKWVDLYARGREWRVIWVPYPGDYAVYFTSERGWKTPAAVWPIWRPKDHDFAYLDHLIYNPPEPGDYLGSFGSSRTDEMPVYAMPGQENRVIVAGLPLGPSQWAHVAQEVQIRQAELGNSVTLHMHGQKSVGRTIGIGVKSFDHPVRLGWKEGFPYVLLPNGFTWDTLKEPAGDQKLWLSTIGVKPNDIFQYTGRELSRKVYEVNLASLRWALLNWSRAWDFRRAEAVFEEDLERSDVDWSPLTLPVRLRKTKSERENIDRWLCDSCSLQNKCPYSREGSVCIVPDSEPAEIAALFGTRNSQSIITGLGALLQSQAHRMQRALRQEEELAAAIDSGAYDEIEDETGKRKVKQKRVVLNKELTTLQNSMFKNAVALAKMVDPGMAKQLGTKVNVQMVNVGVGNDLTPQALMEGVAGVLAERGIDIADATEEQIAAVLAELTGSGPAAIEATGREL